jgi:hypothetical protein
MEDDAIIDWEIIPAQIGMHFEQSVMCQQDFSETRFWSVNISRNHGIYRSGPRENRQMETR